ncbi:hypothetical protein [Salinicoccus halitifaciens]|uniref:Uncharacterized protein n=1 Tax=Salinicoccus halitifaciens TaxID=1073415 RepID=A0ABV2EC37_9STAP|nr:hypothetical protein [Salinicoccus halitifaciens]MCD2138974.1 hypothetical protein [Salinicoccus halitifaciens]
MRLKKFIDKELDMYGISIDKEDLPYVEEVLSSVEESETELEDFPDLKEQLPFTIVDKGEILNG